MPVEAWAVLGPLAAAILVGAWKGFVWFSGWVVDRAVDQFTNSLQEQWKEDIAAAIEEKLEPIYHELSYNEGRSIKDMVRRIERSVEELHAR